MSGCLDNRVVVVIGRESVTIASKRLLLASFGLVAGGYTTLVVLAVLVSNDPAAKIGPWFFGWVLSALAAGVLIGRWSALRLALVTVLAIGFFAEHSPATRLINGAFLAMLSLVGLAVAVGATKLVASRTDLRGSHRPAAVIGGGLALLSCCALALAHVNRQFVVVKRAHPLPIDEFSGRFRGVGIGDTPERVQAALGIAPRWRVTDDTHPVGDDSSTILGGPSFGQAPGEKLDDDGFLRYRGVSLATNNGRVRSLEITTPRAETKHGLGIGDSIQRVRRIYPQLSCVDGNAGTDGSTLPYPYCTGEIAPDRYIFFTGDYDMHGSPIVDIWLASVPMDG